MKSSLRMLYDLGFRNSLPDFDFLAGCSNRVEAIPLRCTRQGWTLMPRRVVDSDAQIADLVTVQDIDRKDLTAVLKKLKLAKQPPLSQPALSRLISEALSSPTDADAHKKTESGERSSALARVILWIGGLYSRELDNLDDVLNDVAEDLQEVWAADAKKLQNWNQHRPLLAELLRLESVGTVVKALDISYEYANVLRYSRIMTDIRPIFDEEADVIKGAVVSFTLRMSYFNAGESRSLSISLDATDLEILSNQCHRALKKAETAQKTTQLEGCRNPFDDCWQGG